MEEGAVGRPRPVHEQPGQLPVEGRCSPSSPVRRAVHNTASPTAPESFTPCSRRSARAPSAPLVGDIVAGHQLHQRVLPEVEQSVAGDALLPGVALHGQQGDQHAADQRVLVVVR